MEREDFIRLVRPRLFQDNITLEDFKVRRGGPYGDDPDQKLVMAMLYFKTEALARRAASALHKHEVVGVDVPLSASYLGSFAP